MNWASFASSMRKESSSFGRNRISFVEEERTKESSFFNKEGNRLPYGLEFYFFDEEGLNTLDEEGGINISEERNQLP